MNLCRTLSTATASSTHENATHTSKSSVDPREVQKFSAMAADWWDMNGRMAPLHRMNPVRLQYMRDNVMKWWDVRNEITPFEGLRLVDVGCGAGLLTESVARLGANVVGVDASSHSIEMAKVHARTDPVLDEALRAGRLQYRHTTAETLLTTEPQSFDIVCAMEIIEHVTDPAAFVKNLVGLLKPGGVLFLSTLNRTLESMALAVIGAEHVLSLVPVGTHDWRKFVTPSELTQYVRQAAAAAHPPADVTIRDVTGLRYNPWHRVWHLRPADDRCNYIAFVASGEPPRRPA